MTTKERLHQLVDQLPETATVEAERFLESLAAGEEGLTAEDRAWLDSDLSHLGEYEPYDWGPEGPPAMKPIRYVRGRGFVVEDVPGG